MKMRTRKTISKRFYANPNKKDSYKRWQANTAHLAIKKTSKRKRHLRKSTVLNHNDFKRLKKIIKAF